MKRKIERSAKCVICGKEMRLYSKANYNMHKLDGYAFASRKIPEYMHYNLYECKECRYIISENTVQVSELFENYAKADFDSSLEADKASQTYIKYLKKYYPDFPKEKAMDIGTGEGSYLKYLYLEKVKKVVGIEPSVAPIESADKRIKDYIVNDVFRADDYEENSFDMISCFQAIEHIPYPDELLGGYCVYCRKRDCFILSAMIIDLS